MLTPIFGVRPTRTSNGELRSVQVITSTVPYANPAGPARALVDVVGAGAVGAGPAATPRRPDAGSRAGVRGVMLTNPGVVNVLGAKLAARVRQMTYQRSLLGLPNVAQRVCCQLWLLVPDKDKAGKSHQNAGISNPPTHLEIAIMLNISRETVTRVFQKLQNRQIVKRDGAARLQVTDLLTLKVLAEGNEEL